VNNEDYGHHGGSPITILVKNFHVVSFDGFAHGEVPDMRDIDPTAYRQRPL
jgi:hypothetical protein